MNGVGSDTGWMQSPPFALFLRVHSAEKLAFGTAQASYCKLIVGDKVEKSTVLARSYNTGLNQASPPSTALWNQKFTLPLKDPQTERLLILVKNYRPGFCPSIGVCAISLSSLQLDQTVDQYFRLYKGGQKVGRVRLQMVINEGKGDTHYTLSQETEQIQRQYEREREEVSRRRLENERAAREALRRLRQEEQRLENEWRRNRFSQKTSSSSSRSTTCLRPQREELQRSYSRDVDVVGNNDSDHEIDDTESDCDGGTIILSSRSTCHDRWQSTHKMPRYDRMPLPLSSDSEESSSCGSSSDEEHQILRELARLKLKVKMKREKRRYKRGKHHSGSSAYDSFSETSYASSTMSNESYKTNFHRQSSRSSTRSKMVDENQCNLIQFMPASEIGNITSAPSSFRHIVGKAASVAASTKSGSGIMAERPPGSIHGLASQGNQQNEKRVVYYV